MDSRQGTAGIANRATRMRRLEIRMVPIRIRYITGGSIGHPVFLQIASRQRADERTRTANPCSLRVITIQQRLPSAIFACSAFPLVRLYSLGLASICGRPCTLGRAADTLVDPSLLKSAGRLPPRRRSRLTGVANG